MPALLALEAYPHPAPARCGVVSAGMPDILADIHRPEFMLAIWDRQLPGTLVAALKPMADAAPFCCVAEDEPAAAVDQLAKALPEPSPIDFLHDVHMLATAMAILGRQERVRIRIEGITGPACHRWHADAVGLRLLTTYRGAATEWLPLAGGGPAARAMPPGARPPVPPRRLTPGAVAVFKGEGYPDHRGHGCIHRSPPAGPGERARLLLCIDEPGRIPLE